MDLRQLLDGGSNQQRKALLRKLIHEITVMSGRQIEPTYKVSGAGSRPGTSSGAEGI